MDGFTFTTEIVKAIAWPISLVTLVFIVRKPIFDLMPLIKKLKYKELELEFSQEVQALRLEAKDAFVERAGCKADNSKLSIALDLVSFSSRAAIIEAWIELEAAAIELAGSFWGQDGKVAFSNYSKLGDYLHQCEVLDDKQLTIFNKLRELRNKSAHAESLNLNDNDARAFVETASNLTRHIKSVK
jgi:hypothetical protein